MVLFKILKTTTMNLKYYNTTWFVITILVISIPIDYVSNYLEDWIMKKWMLKDIYKYLSTFSTISLLTFSISFINSFLWKVKLSEYRLFKWLVDIPNLNGRYEGILESSFPNSVTNENTKKKCVIEIVQNASKITINSYYANVDGTETSKSESFSEEIIKKNDGFYDLYYFFKNNANTLSKGLSNHLGACKLTFYPEDKELRGEYYNDRLCKGNISVKFKSKKIKGKY